MLDKAERDKLVSGLMAYTTTVVVDMARRAGMFHYLSDLLSEGFLCLVESARRYDPEGGMSWKTWATTYVKWCIYRAMWKWNYGYKEGLIIWKTPMIESYDEKVDSLEMHIEHGVGDGILPNPSDIACFTEDDSSSIETRIDVAFLTRGFTDREVESLMAFAFDTTLQELGDRWGMSREGARQIQVKAKGKVMKRLKNGGYGH